LFILEDHQNYYIMKKLFIYTILTALASFLFYSCEREDPEVNDEIDFVSEYKSIFFSISDSVEVTYPSSDEVVMASKMSSEQYENLINSLESFYLRNNLEIKFMPVNSAVPLNGRSLSCWDCDQIYIDENMAHYLCTNSCDSPPTVKIVVREF